MFCFGISKVAAAPGLMCLKPPDWTSVAGVFQTTGLSKKALRKTSSGSSGVALKLFIGPRPSILQALIAQTYLHVVKMAC